MTKIEFILLADHAEEHTAFEIICRHAKKALGNGGLYIHTACDEDCRALDQHIWNAGAQEFIPHSVADESKLNGAFPSIDDDKVVIGHHHEPEGSHYTLLNASEEVPWFFGRFERMVELVRPDEHSRKMGRTRYRYYKRRGYPLQHRQLD